MELQHVNIKLLVSDPEKVELGGLIPVFHRWIEEQGWDELLLDVADYRHVPAGPGVVLIGHQANYSLDNTSNRLGVRYNRKARFDGSNLERLRQAACSALQACQRLEAEPGLKGQIRFNGSDVVLYINDRLLAPNREETRQSLDPELREFFDLLFGGSGYAMNYDTDARRLLGVSVRSSKPVTVTDLHRNLATRSSL